MNNKQKKKRGPGRAILIIIVIALVFGVVFGISKVIEDPEKYSAKSPVQKAMDISKEEAEIITSILVECGVEVNKIEHDELLDEAHVEGEKGYRVSTEDSGNIYLYIKSDNTVNVLKYLDYILYSEGQVIAKLQDYTVTLDEASEWQYLCQEKVKENLKSPSTAEFPNITEWAFGKSDGVITIQSYVDAENGFGSVVRSEFQFKVNMDDKTITSFIFDGEELITQ